MAPRTNPPSGLQYAQSQDAPAAVVDNAPEGVVTAVVSVTGTVDEVGDLIVPGAYQRTLRALTPKVIREHQWMHVIARVLHIEELLPGDSRLPATTGRGKPWPAEAGALIATMQFNLDTDEGRDAFSNARFFGAEQQFSIGYKVVPTKTRRRRDGVRVIGDLDLWEVSTVLWGAHLDTMALQVKSAQAAAKKADRKLRDAVDEEAAAETSGDVDAAKVAAEKVSDAEQAAEEADQVETGLVAEKAVALDSAGASSDGVAARRRAAQKLRAAARVRARRAKDTATLAEMDRRDEWDRAIDLETLAEQRRRSEHRRRYKLLRTQRNQRVDAAEDERVRRARWKAQMARWVRVEKARRRKWSMRMRAKSDALAESIRSIEAKSAAELVAEVKGGVPGVADTPEDFKATRRLFRWYERGEGAALIQWGVDGDFYRCVAIAGKHMTQENAKGFCANRHKGALGTWPGDHDGDGKRDKKSHPADGMEWKAMTQMRGSFEERQRKLEQAVQDMLCPRPAGEDGMQAVPDSGWASVDATFDTRVYATTYQDGKHESYEIPYTFDSDGDVTLGSPTPVEMSVVARPTPDSDPETVDEATAADLRYLTPVLTGFGELAVATKTASLGLEQKGGAWKDALADAARTLLAALDEAGVNVDDPDEPDMGDDDMDDPEYAGGDESYTDDTTDADTGGMGDDEAMPTGGSGFGVLGGDDTAPPADDGGDTMVDPDTGADLGGDVDTLPDEPPADAATEVTPDPMAPAEPGVPAGEPVDDAADGGMDQDVDMADTDMGTDPDIGADPDDADAGMGTDADGGDYDAADEDEDEDDEGDGKPWKKGQKKALILDPADILADLESLRRATS